VVNTDILNCSSVDHKCDRRTHRWTEKTSFSNSVVHWLYTETRVSASRWSVTHRLRCRVWQFRPKHKWRRHSAPKVVGATKFYSLLMMSLHSLGFTDGDAALGNTIAYVSRLPGVWRHWLLPGIPSSRELFLLLSATDMQLACHPHTTVTVYLRKSIVTAFTMTHQLIVIVSPLH